LPEDASEFGDPSRRTYLAAERTLLAWWRTAFAAVAVALGVGRILPDIAHLPKAPFAVLGAGWGLLASAFIVCGTLRQRRGDRAIRAGTFRHLDPRTTVALSGYMLLLTIATAVTLFWRA
jgi:putative membrane protein